MWFFRFFQEFRFFSPKMTTNVNRVNPLRKSGVECANKIFIAMSACRNVPTCDVVWWILRHALLAQLYCGSPNPGQPMWFQFYSSGPRLWILKGIPLTKLMIHAYVYNLIHNIKSCCNPKWARGTGWLFWVALSFLGKNTRASGLGMQSGALLTNWLL